MSLSIMAEICGTPFPLGKKAKRPALSDGALHFHGGSRGDRSLFTEDRAEISLQEAIRNAKPGDVLTGDVVHMMPEKAGGKQHIQIRHMVADHDKGTVVPNGLRQVYPHCRTDEVVENNVTEMIPFLFHLPPAFLVDCAFSIAQNPRREKKNRRRRRNKDLSYSDLVRERGNLDKPRGIR